MRDYLVDNGGKGEGVIDIGTNTIVYCEMVNLLNISLILSLFSPLYKHPYTLSNDIWSTTLVDYVSNNVVYFNCYPPRCTIYNFFVRRLSFKVVELHEVAEYDLWLSCEFKSGNY